MGRKVNDDGKRLIKSHEGCELVGYLCPAGVPTNGFGHTGPDVVVGQRITLQQAERQFEADLQSFANAVDELLAGTPTTDNQFAAMVSLAYNIGIGRVGNKKWPATGFISSAVLLYHRKQQFEAAANSFKNWTKGGGRVLPGLVTRRAEEAALYRKRP